MTNERHFNSRFFKAKLSANNWDLEDFMKFFDLTEDELFEKLNKTFSSSGLKSILREMKSNKKKKSITRKDSESPETETSANSEITQDDNNSSVSHDDSESSDEGSENGGSEIPETADTSPDIEALQKEADELNQSIIDLEIDHRNLVSENLSMRNKLQDLYSKAQKIHDELKEIADQVSSHLEKIGNNEANMQVLNSKIAEKRDALESVNSKIEALARVDILLYANGVIEFSRGDYTIPDSWSDIFNTLKSRDDLEVLDTLTFSDVKQIAKLKAIVQTLSVPYEVLIEKDSLRILWDIIKEE